MQSPSAATASHAAHTSSSSTPFFGVTESRPCLCGQQWRQRARPGSQRGCTSQPLAGEALSGQDRRTMKLGLFLPLAGDATRLREMITVAASVGESAGFHSLWFAEHVALRCSTAAASWRRSVTGTISGIFGIRLNVRQTVPGGNSDSVRCGRPRNAVGRDNPLPGRRRSGQDRRTMKLGLFLPLAGDATRLREMITVAATVGESAGFHSLWFAEHVALFDAPGSRYPYAADGSFPLTGEVGIVEPFVAIAFAAALTTRIRLGTGICLVPQRPPLYTAKQVADAD
ncbi:MAG: LLM class flavin-dependent oxidoreductase, partial [Deltaproteobacteria bacterium]